MSPTFGICVDDLTNAQTIELLKLHLAGMMDNSPPGAVFALDLTGLQDPRVTVFSAWSEDGRIAGIGALKVLDPESMTHGEIKSMRTHPDFVRQGVSKAILEHIVSVARQRGLHKLSLETGRGPYFEAAFHLYTSYGFVEGEAYGPYTGHDFSICMHLILSEPATQSNRMRK